MDEPQFILSMHEVPPFNSFSYAPLPYIPTLFLHFLSLLIVIDFDEISSSAVLFLKSPQMRAVGSGALRTRSRALRRYSQTKYFSISKSSFAQGVNQRHKIRSLTSE